MEVLLRYKSPRELHQWMRETLELLGDEIIPRGQPYTPIGELRERLRLKSSTLSNRLRNPKCPVFKCRKTVQGRITAILETPKLISFLSKRTNNKPERIATPCH